MKRLVLVSCVLLAACGFEMPGGASVDADIGDADTIDVPTDTTVVPTDDTSGDECIGGTLARVCFAAPLTGSVTYTATTVIDTGDSTECAATTNAEAAGWCVVAAANITVNAGV